MNPQILKKLKKLGKTGGSKMKKVLITVIVIAIVVLLIAVIVSSLHKEPNLVATEEVQNIETQLDTETGSVSGEQTTEADDSQAEQSEETDDSGVSQDADSSTQKEAGTDSEGTDTAETEDSQETSVTNGVIGVSDKGYTIELIDGVTYVNGILIANKTYGLPESYAPGDILDEVKEAFAAMQTAAAAEGLNLYISSGYRSYSRQATLYNNYVKADGQAMADTYSARAGHSEHQTGLCFDLNTIDDSFADTAESAWLEQHAQEYGFIIRYPAGKEDITGYQYESWHLRYLGVDLATDVYNSGLCLEEYLGITSAY